MNRFARWFLMGCCALVACSHRGPEPAPGGLAVEDFSPVSDKGFDASDHATDHNDYAWSMEVYAPDENSPGHVYVGTWNHVQQFKGFQDVEPVYPEIRRYRPDLSPTTWETVLDVREYDLTDEQRPYGFRIMKTYRNQSDGKQYLYAGTRGAHTALWRSQTGEPGTWQEFWRLEREGSIRGMAVHNGLLYMAFYNDYALFDDPDLADCLVLATDGQDVWTVIDDGFGDPHNSGVFTLESFNGWLYVGLQNLVQGGEVWKMAGPDPEAPPQCIVDRGGPRRANEAPITMYVYQDHLYVGMVNNNMMNFFGLDPSDFIRINTSDQWETVAGPHSIGGERSGFGEIGNDYVWSMCEYDGWLYAGTHDVITDWTYFLTHPEFFLTILGLGKGDDTNKLLIVADLLLWQRSAGGDIYKSQDGITWYCVTANGFDNRNNYGFRTMAVADGRLFTGTANPFEGLEIWAGAPAR